MEYVPPIGGAANDPYLDANPASGIEGSPVPAAAIEDPQREIVAVITGAGLAPSGGDVTQLRQAIQQMIANGGAIKAPVRLATTANIANLAGGTPNTLDGVALALNDRILVKDQATPSQNGIYVVTTVGGGANGTWTRAGDADGNGELFAGLLVVVAEGTASADSIWEVSTDGALIIGTTAITFTKKSDPGGSAALTNGFRLTLSSGVPVTTADVTNAATIYWTPFTGAQVGLYDGSKWNLRSSAEISIAVPAATNTMHDLFVYDNAGTPTLEALAWTNDTTRATALARQNGILVKSGAPTRRYVGSFRTTGVANRTEDSKANRLLWNYSNRVTRAGRGTFSADRATTSTTYVELNSEIRIGFVIGVAEDAIFAATTGSVGGDANRWGATAITFDGTTVEAGLEDGAVAGGAIGSSIKGSAGVKGFKTDLAAGYHYTTVIGKTDAGTCTWQSATSTIGAKFYSHLSFPG